MKKFYAIILAIIMCCSGVGLVQAQSAEELARAYINARKVYDVELARPILAEDIQITELGEPYTVESLNSFLKFAEATGLNWDIVSCEQATQNKVHCPVLLYNKVTEALDIDPVAVEGFSFEISDGKISKVDLDIAMEFWGPNVWRRFMSYIWVNSPQDFDLMFTKQGLVGVSDEGLELWERHSREFGEAVAAAKANTTSTSAEIVGWTFLEARGNWDVATLAGLLATEVESYDVQRSSNLEDYTNLLGWYESLNWNWTPQSCDEVGNADSIIKLYCVSTLENDWTRAANVEPYIMGWGFKVQDNKIVGIFPEWNGFFVNGHYAPFRSYIEENHSDDFDVMYLEGLPNIANGKAMHDLFSKHTQSFIAQQ